MPHVVDLGKMEWGNVRTCDTAGDEKSDRVAGLVTTPVCGSADIKSFFDRCALSGFREQHGNAKNLLDYRLGLIRNHAELRSTDVVLDLGCGTGHHLFALESGIARGIGVDFSSQMINAARIRLGRSSSQARLTFEVDDAEELRSIADRSVDLVICIGAFEHMLHKQTVLASVYRVLKYGGRFLCLTPNADYLWYRTIAPLLGLATKHLSSDKFLSSEEFIGLLAEAGFRRIRSIPWTFIPRGDMPRFVGFLLTVLDALGRGTGLRSLRGGLCVCGWKSRP